MRCPHCEQAFSFKTRAKLVMRLKAACPSCGLPCYFETVVSERSGYRFGLVLLGMAIVFSLVCGAVPQVSEFLLLPLALIFAFLLMMWFIFRHGVAVKEHSQSYARPRKFGRMGALSATIYIVLTLSLKSGIVEGVAAILVDFAANAAMIIVCVFCFLAIPRPSQKRN